ncbi:flavin reductase [Micromonospora sp. SH-82]|uniref:flavin reductase n=1 Tax=Micromonospora sp. SH-82 TaxID=3132938 RepID=UPI003EBC1B35
MTAGRRPNQRRYRVGHDPARPGWRCQACGIAWPCSAAKLQLLGRFREDRAALLAHLTLLREEATAQLARLGQPIPVAALDDRFVGWARRRG